MNISDPPQNSDLSIIIPCYNEETRIGETISTLISWGKSQNITFELIIANDGSTDGTLSTVRPFEKEIPKLLILSLSHRGKGAAVREGMLKATGKKVLYMDADGSSPLEEIIKLQDALEDGYPKSFPGGN